MQSSLRIGNKYTLLEKIGQGMFGEVYRGHHYKTLEPVAIKFESTENPYRLLKHETTILNYLHEHHCRVVPRIHWFGKFKENVACVMSFYECSLLEVSKLNLSTKRINELMVSAIFILESIHRHYVLHRDIKPQNFMMRNQELYIIDFGLATFYVDDQINHVENFPKKDSILGSLKYASYNIHCGDPGSRRDDLISLGYMYLVLLGKRLPWESIFLAEPGEEFETRVENDIHHSKNIFRKEWKSWEKMKCIVSDLEKNIFNYLQHCYALDFKDRPNYEGLIQQFCGVDAVDLDSPNEQHCGK